MSDLERLTSEVEFWKKSFGDLDRRVQKEFYPEIERLNVLVKFLERNGHEAPCYYCEKPCNALAGNPSQWPIPLTHSDDPGQVKWHHIGCVMARVDQVESLKEENAHFAWRDKDKNKLITELADALKVVTRSLREAVFKEDVAPCAIQNLEELDRRAREAVHLNEKIVWQSAIGRITSNGQEFKASRNGVTLGVRPTLAEAQELIELVDSWIPKFAVE